MYRSQPSELILVSNMKYAIYSALIVAGLMAGVLIYSYEPSFNGVSLTDLADKYDQAPEIKAKYNLENGALVRNKIINPELDKYKGEPKDEVKVVIGNKIDPELMGADETNFEPTIELSRWNEVSFKITPDISDVALKDRTLTFDKEKILFDTPKMSFEMFEYTEGEGGYKFIWYLNEKPKSNIVSFKMETEGLDFFYQPELTQKEIDEGAFRPENVVGSYAVYHKTKGGMNDNYGKDYKVGKVGHIYRPKLIDSNGWEVWGNLHIDAEKGIYEVEIPEDFYNNAVYPIRSNDDFGNDHKGASRINVGGNTVRGSKYTCPEAATPTYITAYCKSYAYGTYHLRFGIYKDETNDIESYVGKTVEHTQTTDNVDFTPTLAIDSSDALVNADYWLVDYKDNYGAMYYDSSGVHFGHQSPGFTYPTFPATVGSDYGSGTHKYSIYCTYEAGGAEEPTKKQDVIWFPR